MLTVNQVLLRPPEDSPPHLVGSACSLQLPGELGELGVVLFAPVLQARLVVGVSFFECRCCGADISHGGASALHDDTCFVDHAPGKALSLQRACFFSSSAVAEDSAILQLQRRKRSMLAGGRVSGLGRGLRSKRHHGGRRPRHEIYRLHSNDIQRTIC